MLIGILFALIYNIDNKLESIIKKLEFIHLDDYAKSLIKEAERMLMVAYAPYSNFYVGAAALMEDGSIHGGCNQENASYPLCICGERVALYNAHVNAIGLKVMSLAIIAKNPSKKLELPVSPCGACRQVIAEFEQKQSSPIEIFLKGETDIVYQFDNSELLLPYQFSGKVLGE